MTVGPALLPIFQQLGIYDDLVDIGKCMTHVEAFKESLQPYRPVDWRPFEELQADAGYGQCIVTRPKLHELFLKQIPPHKIHFGKRVQTISEDKDSVTIHTTDSNIYEGDIVVGADGAYSVIRQSIGRCSQQHSHLWHIYHHLPRQTSKAAEEQRAKDGDDAGWDASPAQTMCDETRNFRILIYKDGRKMTMGDLYDLTPKEFISKVGLEEVFETWYHGRTVLLGDLDSLSQLHPNGGQGTVTAIHDAIALANLLYAISSKTLPDIANAFEEYRSERYPAAKEAFENSQLMSKITDRSFIGAVIFYLYTNMPMWLWRVMLVKLVRFRPQAGFLGALEVKGSEVPVPSLSEEKARALFEKRQ